MTTGARQYVPEAVNIGSLAGNYGYAFMDGHSSAGATGMMQVAGRCGDGLITGGRDPFGAHEHTEAVTRFRGVPIPVSGDVEQSRMAAAAVLSVPTGKSTACGLIWFAKVVGLEADSTN